MMVRPLFRYFFIAIVCYIFFCIVGVEGTILRLNNADPAPLFSADSAYSLLEDYGRHIIKENFEIKEDSSSIWEYCSVSVTPFYQSASTGTNSYGNREILYEDDSQVSSSFVSSESGDSSNNFNNDNDQKTILIGAKKMPLGAIPEPIDFFPLFYPWDPSNAAEPGLYGMVNDGALTFPTSCFPWTNPELSNTKPIFVEDSYVQSDDMKKNFREDESKQILAVGPSFPSDSTRQNLVSKLIARYLGYNHVPWLNNLSAEDKEKYEVKFMYNPLFFDYSNYTNNFFSLLSYPPTRSPNKLFGYGYFDAQYEKSGVRCTAEFKMIPHTKNESTNFGIKIYAGFSQLSMDSINPFDTTSNYQGPTLANMYSRYRQQFMIAQNADTVQEPYEQPNIYQIIDFQEPVVDNGPTDALNDFNSFRTLENYTQGQLANQFKSLFVQNILYNTRALGNILQQNFESYSKFGAEDTTIELYWRTIYGLNKNSVKFPFCSIMPTASIHMTVPTSPEVPSNYFFAKPIGNNGHFEGGGSFGLVIDFLETVMIGCDAGVSFFNSKNYTNVPVPTKPTEEGIFLYQANLKRTPGSSYTFGFGLQSTCFFPNVSFFGEYRFVAHMKDYICIESMRQDLFVTEYMTETHNPSGGIFEICGQNNSNYFNYPVAKNGTLYLNYGEEPPFPRTKDVDLAHLQNLSMWRVGMLNLTIKCDITENCSLGLLWQQPISLYNAYQSTTFGVTIEAGI